MVKRLVLAFECFRTLNHKAHKPTGTVLVTAKERPQTLCLSSEIESSGPFFCEALKPEPLRGEPFSAPGHKKKHKRISPLSQVLATAI